MRRVPVARKKFGKKGNTQKISLHFDSAKKSVIDTSLITHFFNLIMINYSIRKPISFLSKAKYISDD